MQQSSSNPVWAQGPRTPPQATALPSAAGPLCMGGEGELRYLSEDNFLFQYSKVHNLASSQYIKIRKITLKQGTLSPACDWSELQIFSKCPWTPEGPIHEVSELMLLGVHASLQNCARPFLTSKSNGREINNSLKRRYNFYLPFYSLISTSVRNNQV